MSDYTLIVRGVAIDLGDDVRLDLRPGLHGSLALQLTRQIDAPLVAAALLRAVADCAESYGKDEDDDT